VRPEGARRPRTDCVVYRVGCCRVIQDSRFFVQDRKKVFAA